MNDSATQIQALLGLGKKDVEEDTSEYGPTDIRSKLLNIVRSKDGKEDS